MEVIMIHARDDYNRFQDPRAEDEGGIAHDEPVFLIRAQDVTAPLIVETWAAAARSAGASMDIVNKAFDHAKLMREWQSKNMTQIPDL